MSPSANPIVGLDLQSWERAKPILEPAIEHAARLYGLEDIHDSIAAGRLQLWPGENSALVTTVIDYPRGKVCQVVLAGGTLAEIEQMLPRVEAWAKTQGCTMLAAAARRGWARTFVTRKQGWRAPWVELMKDI